MKIFNNNIFKTVYYSDKNDKMSKDCVLSILYIHLIYNIIVLFSIFYIHNAWSLLLSLFITHPNIKITENQSSIKVMFWWMELFKTN